MDMKISEQWFEIFSTEDIFTKEEAYRRAVKQNPSLIEATFYWLFSTEYINKKKVEKVGVDEKRRNAYRRTPPTQ